MWQVVMRRFNITLRPKNTQQTCSIWLIEESHGLPPGSKAIGFDISDSMAPSSHTLPANVSLQFLDARADIPAEYLNAFDVVHIRLVVGAVYDNDPRPILRNMIRMLKSGGMLQWGEIMLDAYVLGKPQSEGMTASRKVMAEVAKRLGTTHVAPGDTWLRQLPTIFEECGLQSVECTKAGEPRREMWKYWGEVLSGAVEEIIAATGIGCQYLPDLASERDSGDYVYVEPRIVTGWKVD